MLRTDDLVVPTERGTIRHEHTSLDLLQRDAARIGIYLTDMEEFPKVNEVYATFFERPFPVRTTVGVAALPKGALVEMDATVPLAT